MDQLEEKVIIEEQESVSIDYERIQTSEEFKQLLSEQEKIYCFHIPLFLHGLLPFFYHC